MSDPYQFGYGAPPRQDAPFNAPPPAQFETQQYDNYARPPPQQQQQHAPAPSGQGLPQPGQPGFDRDRGLISIQNFVIPIINF
jgi:hypothetical protein